MGALARLSFWVSSERMDEFETAYKKKIRPVLKRHGLAESSERGRKTVEGVFSRLFEVETPAEVAVKERALRSDPAWREVLRTFGTDQPDGLVRTHFGLYSTPAGPGKTVEAGPGTRRGVWRTFDVSDGLPSPVVMGILQDREGNLWFATFGGGVSRYDGEQFVSFTTEDGLADNTVWPILEDREGNLWFGTENGGVSRYDGETFVAFTEEDGLGGNEVRSILEDREGHLWFGTWGGGVSRYDGETFVAFTEEDGLPDNRVESILEDREGHLWFGTWAGANRYDGEQFISLEELAGKNVHPILEDRKGHLWFGTSGGVSRYDGEQFITFTTDDGLAHNVVWSILEDREGHLWFGTWGGGVSRYDGEEFISFTTDDGLAHNHVYSILEDQEENLWFGTMGGGVSWYDGEQFVSFTTEHGLAFDSVTCVFQDREGSFWFGTWGGGVSRYDGLVFQNLRKRDGLVNNTVQHILQDRNGDIWITTEGGVTRYRPSHTPPNVRVTDVIADRRYGSVSEIRVPSSQKLLAFEFRGRSFTTHPQDMAYVVRLEGYDSEWTPVYTNRVEYHDLPLGAYTFRVKAVDRDLNYSESAEVRVVVEPDPRLEAFAEALSGTSEEFVGDSDALRRVEEQLVEVAPTDLTVLILGETGTGKGLAARIIHGLSTRKSGPFFLVSCGAIPAALVESELFGHERGAFTGAVSRKLGKVELAEGGTLFLDEIGDMPLDAQVKVLRLLEDRVFERVGGTEILSADVRIVAATNRDLVGMMEEGTFREDLYFRLQEFVVELPSLRERREDIPLLARYFVERIASHLNKEVTHLTPDALGVLQAYDWPGNVRELEHAVRRAVIVCPGAKIRAEDIAQDLVPAEARPADETLTLEELERRHICAVLKQTGWVIAGSRGAAALLGVPRSTLRSRMKKLGIVRPQGG